MRGAWVTGLLALTLGLAAALFDSEPLWVPAATLALLGTAAAGWVTLAARGVHVRRTLGARRVVEDEPLTIVLDVRGGPLRLPPAQVVDALLPAPAPLPAGARAARVRIEARFARRGRRMLALPHVLLADPLGLAARRIDALPSAGHDEVLVLPRVEPVVAAPGGGPTGRLARRGRAAIGAESELDGVRPLRDGTPATRIFWPSIARGAQAQERALAAPGESRPLVVLDPRGAASEPELDAAVRAAASIARMLAGNGGCSVLLPGDRRPTDLDATLAGWPHVHARLALVGPAAGPSLAIAGRHRGTVVFVSARRRARIPPALGPSRAAARVLVVPGTLPARRAAFTVAGCSGYGVDRGARRAAALEGRHDQPSAA